MSSILPNRLFIKLLLGFWLCSSLIIAMVGLLPLLQQQQDRAPLSPRLERILINAAEVLQKKPQYLNSPKNIKMLSRRLSHSGKPLQLYIANNQDDIINIRKVNHRMRRFILNADEEGKPISHQLKDELLFGPYSFVVQGQNYNLYGRIKDHHPRPWFFFFLNNKLLTLSLAILMSGILCGLLAWYLGKPLRSLKQSADALAAGNLRSRVDADTLNRKDEIGQLANAFNSMADAVEAMMNNQQRLMGDISHELRTPLTRLQLGLALARKKGQQSVELDRISYEAEQLEQLISELLTLSRVRNQRHEAKITTGLAESLSQVLDDAEFEAQQQGKELVIDIDEDINLTLNPKLLSRAIENLLRNSIRYANKQINIQAIQVNEQLHIIISDDGPGVEQQELEAIFKPFYRPQSARERETGGWGLGLAITQAAIEAIWAPLLRVTCNLMVCKSRLF